MEKQNSEIRFKCSSDEHDKIQQKASAVNMSIKQYILCLVKNSRVKVQVE
jgi:hypothetical protein